MLNRHQKCTPCRRPFLPPSSSARNARYGRQDETVLESEALPLGHRQTIRKYFQSIRPPEEASPGVSEE